MATTTVLLGLALLIVGVGWRPHGWGPALAAAAAVALAALGGSVERHDVVTALRAQWRAYATLASVMVMTTVAERLGLIDRLASLIEPRIRGPVRRAFRVTFALSACVAAVLSNDAAVLLMTPTVLVLLRTVYPRRHPKFLVPFAFAVFVSAGVAPLVISNPMNLIFAEHAGIDFNEYTLHMAPVALAGSLTAYAILAWLYRDVLDDPAPALGAWPAVRPLSLHARVVLAIVVLALSAYPVATYAGVAVWPVAVVGAALCAAVALAAGEPARALVRGIAWSIFPFLLGVFVLAVALERIGAVEWLHTLYAPPHPLVRVGVVSAIGSALLNNHPMSVLNAFALDGHVDSHHAHAFAALIGGDLGPRLLPVGSLAALLWYDSLRRHGVPVRLVTFLRVGLWLTVPTLAVSLLTLWLTMR